MHNINKIKKWKGHLWQGHFFSSALDDAYTWSSTAAHCGLKQDDLLSSLPADFAVIEQEWSQWLSLPEATQNIDILRRNIEKDLPCGSDGFIHTLETLTDRNLRYRPQGRPVKG